MQTRTSLITGSVLLSLFSLFSFYYKYSTIDTVEDEPSIGAASEYGHSKNHPNNNFSFSTESMSFGALVGGDSDIYIELGTDGSVLTNSQSRHSYIGDFNKQHFFNDPRYLIRSGRLKLNADVRRSHRYLLIDFSRNTNVDGVTLTGLEIIPTDTINAIPEPFHNVQNSIKFEVTHPKCGLSYKCRSQKTNVTIDLSLYGRLTLQSHIKGEVNAQLEASVKLVH